MEKFDVIVSGQVMTDVIFSSIPRMPNLGEEVYCGAFEFTCGGVYNTAVALARLGMKVAIVSLIGNDFLSQFINQSLEAEGVTTTYMKKLDRPHRSLSVGLNYDGDRSFISYQDDMGDFRLDYYLQTVLEQVETKVLHTGTGPDILLPVKLAKEKGIKVSLDVGWDEDWLKDQRLKELIGLGDLFTPNLKEAQVITGESSAVDAIKELGNLNHKNTIIIKLGKEGALLKNQEVLRTVPGFERKPIDTTGAGDVFSAGVITGMLKGFDLYESVRLGNFCGACSVEGMGVATASPFWSRVEEEFLANNKEMGEKR